MTKKLDDQWRTSSRSGENGSCVEVCAQRGADVSVLVRDSKDRPGPVLRFGAAAWQAFVATL